MIDTHLHLLYPGLFRYGWTTDLPALHGSFSMEAYQELVAGSGIEGALFMEVDVDEGQGGSESEYFCQLSKNADNLLKGVIATARPEKDGFRGQIEKLAALGALGIRRILHTQPDNLSQSSQFRKNVAIAGDLGLSFDICALQRQLPLALELVRSCPQTTFVLDHCERCSPWGGLEGLGGFYSTVGQGTKP